MSLYRDDQNDHHNNITTPGNDKIGSNNNSNYSNNNIEESLKYELYENDHIDGRIFLQLLSNNEKLTVMNQFKLECINRLCHIYGKVKVINKNNDKISFISYECSMELANTYNIHHYNYHDTTSSETTANTAAYNTTGTNTIDHKLNDINIPSYLTPIYGSELIVSEFNNDCPIDSIRFIIINCTYNSNTYKYYNNSNISSNNTHNINNIFNQNINKCKNVCIIKTIINYKSIHDIIIPISSSSSSSTLSSRNNFNNNNATHTNYKIIEVLFDKMTIFRSKIILPSKNSQFNHEVISQSPNQFIPYKLPTPIYVSRLSRSSSFSLVHPSSLSVTSTTTTSTISTTPPITTACTTTYTNAATTFTSTTNPSISTPTSSLSSSTSTTIPCNNSKQSRQIFIRIINYLTYLCRNKLLEFFLSFLTVIIWLIIRSNYITIRLNNDHINNIMINDSKLRININNNTSNINTTISDYQYFMTISMIIMITSWIIIFTFRHYILVIIQKSLRFLPKSSSVPSTCNGKVFFVNGWNAWSYCGAVLQGMV